MTPDTNLVYEGLVAYVTDNDVSSISDQVRLTAGARMLAIALSNPVHWPLWLYSSLSTSTLGRSEDTTVQEAEGHRYLR